MSPDVNSLINEATNAFKAINEKTRGLEKKWEGSGLLEGLGSNERRAMSVLLENQAMQLFNESSHTNSAGGNGENWAGVALPLVRKVFGSMASKNFVSVQPMNLPSGLVFYMDFKYGTDRKGLQPNNGSVYGITDGTAQTLSGAQGGLYGAGDFGYSINNATVTGLSEAPIGVASNADINYDDRYDPSKLVVYAVTASAFTSADWLAVRSFVPSGSGVDFQSTIIPEFTKYIPTAAAGAGAVFFVVNSLATGSIANVFYSKQPVDTSRGDFEDKDGSLTNLNIPEIDLELSSETIVAKSRKLKAVWSPELAQDLNAYHSVDAEAELTSMLSDYVGTEIDQEILDMLIQAAPSVDYWSAEVGKVWNGVGFVTSSFTGTAWTNMTWYQTLGQKMQKMSNRIHQLTMRGGANFAVVSPTAATILETIPGFAADTGGDKMEFTAGITKIGTFHNKFTVYKNPYMTENVMLVGFRGSQFLETGAVYAPYIPLIMTPLVYDPNNFTPRRGVMTRYAKKVVRPEFFGKIYLASLNLV